MFDGKYIYWADLQAMRSCKPPRRLIVPPELGVITTPLVASVWEAELRGHPDSEFADFLVEGIRCRFRIGFDYSSQVGISATNNMHSAREHPEPIDRYVREEMSAGRIIRLSSGSAGEGVTAQGIHVSRFGVIPKSHQPGKWRLISDLSSPKGSSVNDGVSPSLCSVSYAAVDDAVRCILALGQGALLAKFDVASAYRVVPVHPEDRLLLGMKWRGELLVDGALPFGLRSAPKLLTAMADTLLWIMGRHGVVHAMHYLDDYLLLGPPRSMVCDGALRVSLDLCKALGVPIAEHKLEGPAPSLSFLGIQIDTIQGTLALPQEKLDRIKALITSWRQRKCCKKRELLSLIGQLQHACRVVKSGRTFLRRMIDLSAVPKELDHWVRLNNAFHSDLQWWHLFLEDWNGTALCSSVVQRTPTGTITSDASGRWGCGAFTEKGEWFQFCWPASWANVHITVKELLPIVVACAVWGHQWRGATVQCLCDNAAVVAIVKSGTSRDSLVMHLMRCLFFFTASHQLLLLPQHLPGKENTAADHLSRDALPLFLQIIPYAKEHPTALSEDLMAALVSQRPDWTSESWRAVLRSSLSKV